MKKIEEFIGAMGVTSDPEFAELADVLEEVGHVVAESEPTETIREGAWFDSVSTTYRVEQKFYELWYQLRTPFAPGEVECGYGFNEVASV